MPRRHILCISGGGYAGLFAAKFLALLEEQLSPDSTIGAHFDAFAGTSVGGLIALALAKGERAQKVLRVMKEVGTGVFPHKRGGLLRAVWGPKHAVAPLRQQLKSLLGQGKFGDLARPALITAVDLSTGAPKIFRTYPQRASADGTIALTDVALATSAAPIYFAPHKIGSSLFADGALVAKIPDHLAVLEALDQWGWPKDDIFLLSIGTTYTPTGVLTHSATGWGLLEWARNKKLLGISMSAQMALASDVARRLLPPNHITRVDPGLSPAQAAAIGLDISTKAATETLQALAQSQLDALNSLTRKQFLGHIPAPP